MFKVISILSYFYGFSDYAPFFGVGSGLHFFIFLFCHCGWSALWLSQTVLFFKLAHNVLALGDGFSVLRLRQKNLAKRLFH